MAFHLIQIRQKQILGRDDLVCIKVIMKFKNFTLFHFLSFLSHKNSDKIYCNTKDMVCKRKKSKKYRPPHLFPVRRPEMLL